MDDLGPQLQSFQAATDQEIVIGVKDVFLSMPIFRWTGTDWVDATGDYDLCMSRDQTSYTFINRRATTETFAYRYLSLNWLVNRLGLRK